jgi:uncharacterized membrane protein
MPRPAELLRDKAAVSGHNRAMSSTAAITINRPREEVERLWPGLGHNDLSVTFRDAPGDRGTELYATVEGNKLTEAKHRAQAKDELRRFKQQVETGEISRSDAVPTGERAGSKLKQRPAQPLRDSELKEAGAR